MFKKPKDRGNNQLKSREFIFTEEMQKEISNNSPIDVRMKALKELCKIVTENRLDQEIIGKLFYHTQDLLTNQPDEVRRSAFIFLQHLAKGQREKMDLTRTNIFKIAKEHIGDIPERFDLLQALTDNGKDIRNLEFEIAHFLLGWLPDIANAGIIDKYLCMLDTMIKYNAGYIEEDVITGLVRHISYLCCNSQESEVRECLKIFETIIAYSNLLPDFLPLFVGTLCRSVTVEAHCELSWNIMRKLLGTHMGHSSLLTMCSILRQDTLKNDVNLLRGAVFCIGMALWGKQPLMNLKCSVCAILPSIYQAVQYLHPVISYEVMICVSLLISRHGTDLQDAAWDTILNILSVIIQQVENEPKRIPNPQTKINLHETLTVIENFVEAGRFNGSTDRFFEIIGECSKSRPEKSVSLLIAHLSESIKPTQHLWLNNLYNLLQRYFKQETRTNIRLKVLEVLANVVNSNRMEYEDELIDKIVINYLSYILNDPDIVVRSFSAELLIELCVECESKRCLEMLEILEKLLVRPFDTHHDNQPINEVEIFDVKTVVMGLIKIFTIKIHKLPSSHAVKIYKMLVNFLELHYSKPKLFENCNQLRYKIFDCFLNMRADSLYHLGCLDANGDIKHSSYLCVTYSNDKGPMTSPPPTSPAIQCYVTYVSVKYAFKMFITCLKMEKDWDVLNHVLMQLPHVLRNKSLILTKQGNPDMHLIVDALSTMITEKALPDTIQINKTQYNAAILSVLANLASYHAYLNQPAQQEMISCLYKYLSFQCARLCITALTICTLEMREVMVKMLPQVLLSLSKISATDRIAIPVLEFLSTLTVLPMVFANFVADQYMAVFAISLPYTNPFKYNHYIVSLAHHVISVWFLKCRLPFRKDFVRFITNSLQTNALTPFGEATYIKPADLNKLNQDSSDRKRSSSLTEQGSKRPVRARLADVKPILDFKIPTDKSTATFYEELTETCIDLMARYAFSPCSAVPRRLPTTEFLLSGGQSMSWLLGNKLVTVTTSGCSQKALKFGLCDRCYTSCKIDGRTPDDSKLKSMRSGSTEKDKDDSSNRVTRQNSGDKSNTNTSTSSPIDESKRLSDKLEQLPSKLQQLTVRESNINEKLHCACWCQGWAEIYIRRPTGDMSWVMRIQNQISYQYSMYEFPLNEISILFTPSLHHMSSDSVSVSFEKEFGRHQSHSSQEEEYSTTTVPISIPGSPNKHSPSRQSSKDSIDEDLDNIYEDGTKSRNPVRRSNSSPEMSANWKNPFLQQKQERDELRIQDDECVKKMKKDMRVSCEAIPEEIAGMGTTPPTESAHQTHPSLLSSLSFPGTTPPTQEHISKNYQTVPASPNINQITSPPLGVQTGVYGTRSGILKSTKSDSIDSMSSDKSTERPSTLPTLTNLAPLTSKPPQSPTQTSPRLSRHSRDKEGNEIQKSSSLILEKPNIQYLKSKDRRIEAEKLTQSDQNLSSQIRSRGHTISVMSPVRKPRSDLLRHTQSSRSKEAPKSGISPSFIFLQLYHAAHFKNPSEKPLLIDSNDVVQRALTVLDCIPPYETHRIGVIYVGHGQCNIETEILKNKFGSVRYVEFLQNLGTLIKLSDVDPQVIFLGGLEQGGNDGKFSYIWQDDVIRVMFHVATLMPNKESDPNCHEKKRHIGNNNVTIVYNESGDDYHINTIKGQFNFACIIIQPLDHYTNKVTVKVKEELYELIGQTEPKIVSDQNVAILARQLALHANLASLVCNSLKNANQNPYASNWLERLRKIKQFRNKILQDSKKEHDEMKARRGMMEDFTEYT
ncbi:tuberin [Holotrichia oblita]|uniref:Tuberin n=1 Tax=Holotrichia oblita TaxID=644536 RepID=A0ACB9SNK1_HOLOL|nr:tuberin [Holotrichia oblita]